MAPITVTFPEDTIQHQTNYKRDWEGQEFFYVIHRNQSGIKKIVSDRIYLDINDAIAESFRLGQDCGLDYEVRLMVCPYLDGPEP